MMPQQTFTGGAKILISSYRKKEKYSSCMPRGRNSLSLPSDHLDSTQVCHPGKLGEVCIKNNIDTLSLHQIYSLISALRVICYPTAGANIT